MMLLEMKITVGVFESPLNTYAHERRYLMVPHSRMKKKTIGKAISLFSMCLGTACTALARRGLRSMSFLYTADGSNLSTKLLLL